MKRRPLSEILFIDAMLALLFVAGTAFCQTRYPPMTREGSEMLLIKGGGYIPFSKEAGEKAKAQIKFFWMDSHEVTNAEFLRFVRANPKWQRSRVKSIFADRNYLKDWSGDLALGEKVKPTAPVIYVSWFAAQAYCNWVSKRLPTTDEWEYALKAMRVKAIKGSKTTMIDKTIREWTADFNSILLENTQTDDGNSPSILSCGGSSVDVNNPRDYQAFLRYSFRSSLKADYCLANLGFRCAQDVKTKLEISK
jgi:sulfatase modifying factor 1